MASEDGIETDSPYFPSNSIIPRTVLEDLCRLVRNYSSVFFYFVVWLLISAYCSFFSRFLINIPEEERKDIVRLCFQIETAHWFYVDFYRQEQPDLPPCGLKDFTKINILFLNIYHQLHFEWESAVETVEVTYKPYLCTVIFNSFRFDALFNW